MNKDRIARCLSEMRGIIKNYHADMGTCDHEVGICWCGEYSILAEASEIIDELKGGRVASNDILNDACLALKSVFGGSRQ